MEPKRKPLSERTTRILEVNNRTNGMTQGARDRHVRDLHREGASRWIERAREDRAQNVEELE